MRGYLSRNMISRLTLASALDAKGGFESRALIAMLFHSRVPHAVVDPIRVKKGRVTTRSGGCRLRFAGAWKGLVMRSGEVAEHTLFNYLSSIILQVECMNFSSVFVSPLLLFPILHFPTSLVAIRHEESM